MVRGAQLKSDNSNEEAFWPAAKEGAVGYALKKPKPPPGCCDKDYLSLSSSAKAAFARAGVGFGV
jgi:hypothetical protein